MSVFIKGLNRFIKGMKMPKLEKTYKVRLYKAVDGRIIVTACGVKDNLLRPVGEVIEVPTPHGRLGDLDALRVLFADWYRVLDDKMREEVALRYIDDAPTVIEAEGDET